MDADDLMHPRRLLLQVTRLDSPPHVDVLATRVRSIGQTGEGMRRYVDWQNGLLGHEELMTNLFVESPIAHPSVLMRREIFERAGGYHDPRWAEDFDLWHRVRERGARLEKLPRAPLSGGDSQPRVPRSHADFFAAQDVQGQGRIFQREPLL